jgi:hypothetical protein
MNSLVKKREKSMNPNKNSMDSGEMKFNKSFKNITTIIRKINSL